MIELETYREKARETYGSRASCFLAVETRRPRRYPQEKELTVLVGL